MPKSKAERFRYLTERKSHVKQMNKDFEQLTDEELLNLAYDDEAHVPTPVVLSKRKTQQRRRQFPRTLWLEQNGFISGATYVHKHVMKYVLIKKGKSIKEADYMIKRNLAKFQSKKRGFFRLLRAPFEQYIDGINLVLFGDILRMSKKYEAIFKDEYGKEAKKEEIPKT